MLATIVVIVTGQHHIRIGSGRCEAWCSEYTCDERNKHGGRECDGCDVCQPPPAPPLPPFGPQLCANTFEACGRGFVGPCCVKASDGCFQRTGLHFSLCRPLPTGSCISDNEWTCPDDWIERFSAPSPPRPPQLPGPPGLPPSAPCTAPWQFCDTTHCCADASRFACYKRKASQGNSFMFGVNGTQCRFKAKGMGGMFTKKVYVDYPRSKVYRMECEESNTSAWLCPQWAVPPPSPPPPPGAPRPPRDPALPAPGWPDELKDEPCVEPFESCWGAMPHVLYGPRYAPLFCCLPDELGRPFTCMRRAPFADGGGGQFAMCRRAKDDGSCIPADGWLCPHTPPPSPPPPLSTPVALGRQPDDGCHGNYKPCWENVGTAAAGRGCCLPDGRGHAFACMRRPGLQFAMCRPLPRNGPCESDAAWECPDAPPPAPPAACALAYQSCVQAVKSHGVLELGCCEPGGDGRAFGCFRRPGREFAQCRPMPQGPCVSTGEWECPLMPPPAPPSGAYAMADHASMSAHARAKDAAAPAASGALIVGATVLIVLCGGALRVLQRIEKMKQEQGSPLGVADEEGGSDDEAFAVRTMRKKKKKKDRLGKDGRVRVATAEVELSEHSILE